MTSPGAGKEGICSLFPCRTLVIRLDRLAERQTTTRLDRSSEVIRSKNFGLNFGFSVQSKF